MRSSEKKEQATRSGDLFGFNLHEFIEKERHATHYELASEFGLTLKDVRKLKKQLRRN